MNTFGRKNFKRSVTGICTAILGMVITISSNAQLSEPIFTEAELAQLTPFSPDPFLADLAAGVEPDIDYWTSHHYWKAVNNPPILEPRVSIETDEVEPNDFRADAQFVDLGTGFGQASDVTVTGNFVGFTFVHTPVQEENGSIPTAAHTGVGPNEVTAVISTIGDGIHGSSGTQQGDFDFYATDVVPVGSVIEAEIVTADNGDTFAAVITIWDSSGTPLAHEGFGTDPSISFKVPQTGVYYVSVGGLHWDGTGGTGGILCVDSFPCFPTNDIMQNPFQPGSGGGYGDEGDYNLTLRVTDTDYVSVNLRAGDVLALSSEQSFSVAVEGSLESENGLVLLSSLRETAFDFGINASFYYPESHPYRNILGAVHGTYVIPETGTYYIAFRGSSPSFYEMDLRVRRPLLEISAPTTQKLYLNMGEASFVYVPGQEQDVLVANRVTIDPKIFFDDLPEDAANLSLSPLFNFLDTLELTYDDDESKLNLYNSFVNQIVSYVNSQLPANVQVVFGVRPVDEATTASQVYVAGTVAEVQTAGFYGISESIDPGNFDVHDEALVLVGLIAEDAVNLPFYFAETGDSTLDDIEEQRVRRLMYTRWIGNVILHEAGHFIGNFHTENGNDVLNIMDAGGTLISNRIGSGPDGIFNTLDDRFPRYQADLYDVTEFFTDGIEDSEGVVFYGVNGNAPDLDLSNLFVDYEASGAGIGSSTNPFNIAAPAVQQLLEGGTINIYTSDGRESFTGVSLIDKPMTLRNETPEAGPVTISGN